MAQREWPRYVVRPMPEGLFGFESFTISSLQLCRRSLTSLSNRPVNCLVRRSHGARVHFHERAVVSHETVDLDLHIGRLRVNGGGETCVLDHRVELLQKSNVILRKFPGTFEAAIAPVFLLLPGVAFDRQTESAKFAEDH